jgi:malonyl CoA-acyl carrier protein transacylase/acyl carrier protein
MGRELYDNFPIARAAMDSIATLADWDVLALMDESELETISQSRRQLPYLFLLEYAQWSQLVALGAAPAVLCGHSLGEMVALCFAGVYSPEVAWEIMETRARQMVNLEIEAAHGTVNKTGMLSVHAEADVIDRLRAAFPHLHVSNYNTPTQFILSGPRDMLLEVRKNLRARKIPSIMLNVALAFHHPSMRILRDPALYWLNAFEMHTPRVPVLSCATTNFYPHDQPSIARYIADLDENSVRWTECVHTLWGKEGIRHFLELGPQDILCGLVNATETEALCLPAGRKGKETEQLLRVCARLYELGHTKETLKITQPTGKYSSAPTTTPPGGTQTGCVSEELLSLLDMLAKACGRPAEELCFEMDLRYDLALRSSRFPALVQEAEQRFGITVNFEKLLTVSTIADLARIFGLKSRDTDGPPFQTENTHPVRNWRSGIMTAPHMPLRHDLIVRDFVERPAVSSLVFPDAHATPAVPLQLRGACHFSIFTEPALAAHGGGATDYPHLPICRALQPLADGARLLFPSLSLYGLADVRFYQMPLLPPGITRECRLVVRGRPCLVLNHVKTRRCSAELYVHNLTDDGRRSAVCTHLSGGFVWMTTEGVPPPLCPEAENAETGGNAGVDVSQFYDALGIGNPWRFLQRFTLLQNGNYRASVFYFEEFIAQNKELGYTNELMLFEATMQAAGLAVTLPESALSKAAPPDPASFGQWRPAMVRFVRFGETGGESGQRHIHLQKTWADETLLRFHARVTDARGKVLLTVHSLEFTQKTAPWPVCDADF